MKPFWILFMEWPNLVSLFVKYPVGWCEQWLVTRQNGGHKSGGRRLLANVATLRRNVCGRGRNGPGQALVGDLSAMHDKLPLHEIIRWEGLRGSSHSRGFNLSRRFIYVREGGRRWSLTKLRKNFVESQDFSTTTSVIPVIFIFFPSPNFSGNKLKSFVLLILNIKPWNKFTLHQYQAKMNYFHYCSNQSSQPYKQDNKY